MEDGDKQTAPIDDTGKEVDTPVEAPVTAGTAMADKAIQAAERLEKANDTTGKNLDRQEALMARQALGGTTGGGIERKPKTQDELDEEAAKVFMQEDE